MPTSAAWTVLVTDYEYDDLHVEEETLHAALGDGVRLVGAQCRDERQLARVAREADALLNQYCPVGAAAIAALDRCRVISRYGVGFDTVDVAAATRRGICVTHVPDYCVDEVSDHALALLLAWARRVVALDGHVRRGAWDYKLGRPIHRLRTCTLGLLGFGRMARAVGAKAQALGLRLLAHDPLLPAEAIRAGGAEPVPLDELARRSDFLSVHVPLTAATRGLVDGRLLGLMKPTALLVNTSRGAVVDEQALVAALRAGRPAGAALDVLACEPAPSGHPLLSLPNVIVTPHVAWYSEESELELRRKAVANVIAVLSGQRPPHLVNPEAWRA